MGTGAKLGAAVMAPRRHITPTQHTAAHTHTHFRCLLSSATQGAWARGRLLAVGDAAHSGPTDGQGANLAMEDAAVLGACVRKHGLGPEVSTSLSQSYTSHWRTHRRHLLCRVYLRRCACCTTKVMTSARPPPQAFAAWEAARQPRVAAILGDRTPNAAVRTPLIQQAAFERLWSAEQVAAAAAAAAGAAAGAGAEGAEGAGSEGGVPLEVAAQVAAAAAAGGEAAAAEVRYVSVCFCVRNVAASRVETLQCRTVQGAEPPVGRT